MVNVILDDQLDGNLDDFNVTYGTEFDDKIFGDRGNDTLDGLKGDDYLIGEKGDDLLDGGLGDDTLSGGAGIDIYMGGDGIDRVIDSGADSYILTNSKLINNEIIERLFSIEAATLVGNSGSNRIDASQFTGKTVLSGLGGFDQIYGGSNRDEIYGGDGSDHLYGGDGDDLIRGGMGLDHIDGGTGINTLDGGDGYDFLDVRSKNSRYSLDMITGVTNFAGETAINFEAVYTGRGNDNIQGTQDGNFIYSESGNNVINGRGGDDYLSVGDGNDFMNGGSGDDYLYADRGDDILRGGTGNDNLYGGLGNDTLSSDSLIDSDQFWYDTPGFGIDTILDFDVFGVDDVDKISIEYRGTFSATDGAKSLDFGVLPTERLVSGGADLGINAGFRYFGTYGELYFDSNGGGFDGSHLLVTLDNQPTFANFAASNPIEVGLS